MSWVEAWQALCLFHLFEGLFSTCIGMKAARHKTVWPGCGEKSLIYVFFCEMKKALMTENHIFYQGAYFLRNAALTVKIGCVLIFISLAQDALSSYLLISSLCKICFF